MSDVDNELVAALRDLLRAGQAEPHTVLLLTDEELAAVTTPDAAGPSPWLDRLTGEPREVAAQFGGRSLLSRGLIRAAPGVGSPEDPNLEAAMELRVVVDTRLIGLGYVRADRGTADDGVAKIAVVQPELGVLEEEVSAQGFHLFTSCTYDMAAYRMARWALPASVAATPGATATMPADRWPAFAWGELSANPRDVTVELFLSPADGGTAAERWFLAHDERLALLARPVDGSDEQLRVGPVDRGALQDVIAERMHEAVDAARSPAAPQ